MVNFCIRAEFRVDRANSDQQFWTWKFVISGFELRAVWARWSSRRETLWSVLSCHDKGMRRITLHSDSWPFNMSFQRHGYYFEDLVVTFKSKSKTFGSQDVNIYVIGSYQSRLSVVQEIQLTLLSLLATVKIQPFNATPVFAVPWLLHWQPINCSRQSISYLHHVQCLWTKILLWTWHTLTIS